MPNNHVNSVFCHLRTTKLKRHYNKFAFTKSMLSVHEMATTPHYDEHKTRAINHYKSLTTF